MTDHGTQAEAIAALRGVIGAGVSSHQAIWIGEALDFIETQGEEIERLQRDLEIARAGRDVWVEKCEAAERERDEARELLRKIDRDVTLVEYDNEPPEAVFGEDVYAELRVWKLGDAALAGEGK